MSNFQTGEKHTCLQYFLHLPLIFKTRLTYHVLNVVDHIQNVVDHADLQIILALLGTGVEGFIPSA